MWWPFQNKRAEASEEYQSFWKEDFSDCVAIKYLPDYSVCKCKNNRRCRYVAMYAGLTLCCNPKHRIFVPEGSAPYDPHEGPFF